MDIHQNPSSTKPDRKTIEKNRRNQMKALYSKLISLVPHQPSKGVISLPDQVEGAINYIKKLQEDLEEMKKKKERLLMGESSNCVSNGSKIVGEVKLPNIEIHVVGSVVDVVLVTGLDHQFMFRETIRLLYEEGAEVVSASFALLDDSIFHTIHSKIGEVAPEHEAARISEKLRKFVYDQ